MKPINRKLNQRCDAAKECRSSIDLSLTELGPIFPAEETIGPNQRHVAPVKVAALNRNDAANYIGSSSRTLDKLVKAEIIARVMIGTKPVFRVVDLDEFLESGLTKGVKPRSTIVDKKNKVDK